MSDLHDSPIGDPHDSLGKNPRTTAGLRDHWAGYWEDLVEDLQDESLETIDGQPNLRNAFRKDTSLGQSERTIAEDHPNREILELLQNARDEAKYAEKGRVFLAVTDDGLLIANNGRSFNFHNRAVEEAATGIGKTSKDTPDEIGKMGIGLKSILGKGESFEVWTKAPDATADTQPLRVRFSKGYLLAAILDAIGYDHGVDEIGEEFNSDVFPVNLDLDRDPGGIPPATLSEDNRRALMQLFLFAYPVPMSLSARRTRLAKLADFLVHGNERAPDPNPTLADFGGEFTTAVFVEFADENWRQIVTALYDVDTVDELSEAAIEEAGISTTTADRVWQYVDGTRSGSLDPETLVHFETIDCLDATRISEGYIHNHVSWEVTDEDGVLDDERLAHTEWTVRQVERGSDDVEDPTYTFDGFQLPDAERAHDTCVLVPRPPPDWPAAEDGAFDRESPYTVENYPLYLYYPISQRDPGLSFSLHGEFAVTPNRQNIKDVSQRYVDYNRRVIEEATRLVGRVATRTATLRNPDCHWQSLYPWVLLPNDAQVGEWDPSGKPTETDELLGYLRQQLLDRIRGTGCLPTATGGTVAPATATRSGSDATFPSGSNGLLLDWHPDGWDGLRALYLLSEQLPLPDCSTLAALNRPFPAHSEVSLPVTVPSFQRLCGLWQLRSGSGDRITDRVESLLDIESQGEETLTAVLRDRWVSLVAATLRTDRDAAPSGAGIRCPAGPADAVLSTTARYFETASGSEIGDLLTDEYAADLDGAYLLPCQLDKVEPEREEAEPAGGGSSSSEYEDSPPDDEANPGDEVTDKDGAVIKRDDAASERVLLEVENQRLRSEGNRRQPLSRTILWNVPDEATDVIAPPEGGNFTVFFLAELADTDQRVHSMLDEAGEAWGIRKYQTDRQEYFRSLIASFDQTENYRVPPTALAFLADRVEEFTSADLTTLPHGYLAHDLLETILENGEYDHLRTRFRLRNARFDLGSESGPTERDPDSDLGEARSTSESDPSSTCLDPEGDPGSRWQHVPLGQCEFGPAWWPYLDGTDLDPEEEAPLRRTERTVEGDGSGRAGDPGSDRWETNIGSDPHVRPTTLPAPSDPLWESIYDRMETTDQTTAITRIARILCVFGVGLTADLKALCHHGPGLQRPREGVTKASWDSREWDLPDADPYRSDVEALQTELGGASHHHGSPEYLPFVTGHGNHSTQTGDHTSYKCHGQPYTAERGYGSRVSAWVWSPDLGHLTRDPDSLVEWLDRHGDTLRQTALETGWYCDGNGHHIQRSWSSTIPTLFNWQLRNRACWGPLFEEQFSGWVAEAWGEDAERLRWAVQSEGRGEVTQLLPTVPSDPETATELDTDILTSLGVEPIRELSTIQAADRLQHLQAVLSITSGRSLDETGPVKLRTDGVESAWMYVYTELLNPILDALSEDDDAVPDILESDLLTHLPMRYRNTEWYAVPIEWIRDDEASSLRYHTRQTLRQWEKQEARNSKLYLLKPPTRGGLKPLADALGIPRLDVDRPILDATDLEGLSRDGLGPVRRELERRTEWILATLNRTSPEAIREARDTFQTAVDNLARTSLTEGQTDDFFDSRSRLYRVSDDDGAAVSIVLNDDELESTDTADLVKATAPGIAFLFEMPGRYEEVQPALRRSLPDPAEIDREWEQRGHDIELVRTALGQQDVHELLRDVEALYDLVGAFEGASLENADRLRSNLAEADSAAVQWFRRQFDPERKHDANAPSAAIHDAVTLLDGVKDRLPAAIEHDARPGVFGAVIANRSAAHEQWVEWVAALEAAGSNPSTLVNWVAAHPRLVSEQWVPANGAQWCGRVEQFCVLRDEREDADLASVAALESALGSVDPGARINWAETPTPTANFSGLEFDVDGRWFAVAPRETFEKRVLKPLVETVADHAPGGRREAVAVAIREFVLDGAVPEEETGSRQRQRHAFRELQQQLDPDLDIDLGGSEGPRIGQTTVATFGGGGGDGGDGTESRSYGERGERAEAAAVLHILQRLGQWLDRSDTDFENLIDEELAGLEGDQNGAGYKWHTKNRWNGSLERCFAHDFSAEQYRSLDRFVDGDSSLWEDPLVRILNSTQEYGLGFDFIDPFGPATEDSGRDAPSVEVVPVEVKAAGLSTESDAVSFRFSTNQLRQARAFVEAGYRYVIRLFATPAVETDNWLAQTRIVDEIILDGEHPPAAALGGTTPGKDGAVEATIPAEAVAGGEMYIERKFR